MAELAVILFANLVIVPLSWALPRAYAMEGVAIFSALVIGLLAPVALLWLFGTVLVSWMMARRLQIAEGHGAEIGAAAVLLIAALVILRELDGIALIGGAYFTLRALHLIFDVWMRKLPAPSLREVFRYLCYLPVMAIGPINRFQTFQRSIDRRRFDAQALSTGAERVLFGLFQATVLGGWILPRLTAMVSRSMGSGFEQQWAVSACSWITLYFVFAGFSSVAIGISLMCGIKIEENFRAPYRATSLIDFWTRWHITLSFWCRDYVFQPVSVLLRSPLIGLFAAMAAIGLWHETSVYYVLWAVWQTLGIVLNRIAAGVWRKMNIPPLPQVAVIIIAPVMILGWLSLARPVIDKLLW